jgi:hypothetical protein
LATRLSDDLFPNPFVTDSRLHTPTDVSQEGILGALAADAEIRAIKAGEVRTLQPLAVSTLIVINDREIAVRGDIVHKEFQHFSASLDTTIEFGISFCKGSHVQIGAA